jgi:hypothetical protein
MIATVLRLQPTDAKIPFLVNHGVIIGTTNGAIFHPKELSTTIIKTAIRQSRLLVLILQHFFLNFKYIRHCYPQQQGMTNYPLLCRASIFQSTLFVVADRKKVGKHYCDKDFEITAIPSLLFYY